MLNAIQDASRVGAEMGDEILLFELVCCLPSSCPNDFSMMMKLMNASFDLPGPTMLAGDFRAYGMCKSTLSVPNYLLLPLESIHHGG